MWHASSLPYLTPQAGQGDAWAQEAAQAGRTGTQRLRAVTAQEPPREVADALRLRPGEDAVARWRVILLDGAPVELATSWYPARLAAGTALAAPAKIKGGAVRLLSDLGYTAAEALEDVSFRPATDEEAGELGVPAGTHVIALFRTVLDAEGDPFEVSTMTMLAQGRHLQYRLTLGGAHA